MNHAASLPSSVVPSPLMEAQQQAAEELVYATLPGLLPAGSRLVIHRHLGIVTVLTCEQDSGTGTPLPRLMHQQTFTSAELALLLPIIAAYPDYCPNELLLASFACGPWHEASEEDVATARDRLHRAERQHATDRVMKPVRNVLSRVRLKLHALGITVASILETGYQLMPLQRVRVSPQKGKPRKRKGHADHEENSAGVSPQDAATLQFQQARCRGLYNWWVMKLRDVLRLTPTCLEHYSLVGAC